MPIDLEELERLLERRHRMKTLTRFGFDYLNDGDASDDDAELIEALPALIREMRELRADRERLEDALRQTGDWAKCDHCERLAEDPWHWGESLMCDTCYGWATTSGASEDDPFRRQEAKHFHQACENRHKRREKRIAEQAVRAFASELCGLDYNVVQERIFAKVMEAMDEDDAARGHAEQGGADGQG